MDQLVHCLLLAMLVILAEPVVIEQLSASSRMSCCAVCSSNTNCKGVVYDIASSLCRLHDARDTFPMWSKPSDKEECQRLMPYSLMNGPPVNLAQNYVNALQSSTDLHFNGGPSRIPLPAELAVDGNKNGDFYVESCTSTTDGDLSPWFRLELDDTYQIGRIVITNRQDCCSERLRDFKVTLDGVLCHHYTGVAPADDVEIECDNCNMFGRTIEISQESHHLTICEIEIFTF